MKLTKSQLQRIIKEEVRSFLGEADEEKQQQQLYHDYVKFAMARMLDFGESPTQAIKSTIDLKRKHGDPFLDPDSPDFQPRVLRFLKKSADDLGRITGYYERLASMSADADRYLTDIDDDIVEGVLTPDFRKIIREELKDAITETESSDEEFHRLFRPHFENSDLGPRDIGAYNLHVRGLLRDRGYEMPEDMAAAHSLARRAINRVKAAKRLKR